jgi:mRNA-degrading endonuclease RelE of RelBE toxin-antitoxin system
VARRPLDLPHEYQRAIAALHPDVKRRVRAALDAIREDPTFGDPLEGELDTFRKIALGSWRLVYRADARAIRIYALGRRATVYSELVARLRGVKERRRRYRRR